MKTPAKILTIRWQRLTDERGATCPRCSSTGDAVVAVALELTTALQSLGIVVQTERRALTPAEFAADPLASNRIWIADRPLEDWLGATTGHSPCCDQCGDADCRTLEVDGASHEAVPRRLILKACLLAAAQLVGEPSLETEP